MVIAWRKVVAGAEDSLQGVVDERAEESVASFERRAGVLRKLLGHCTGAIVDSKSSRECKGGSKGRDAGSLAAVRVASTS